MKKIAISIFIFIVLSLITLIGYSIFLNSIQNNSVDDKIMISLIGSLTAIITVIGSFFVNQFLAVQNSREQRAEEIRKMKQTYYHNFTESFLLRIAYLPNMKSTEFSDADKTFCIEKNRLPLYASQEIVEYVEKGASGKELNMDFKTLFELIRNDLKSDDFKNFENLSNLSVTLPADITRQGTVK